jgi:hypothetical protein
MSILPSHAPRYAGGARARDAVEVVVRPQVAMNDWTTRLAVELAAPCLTLRAAANDADLAEAADGA